MRKNNGLLICIMLAGLILCCALGLMLDPETQAAALPVGEYRVQITEVCAKNETVIADNEGKYRDYIELYNAGPETDLTGCRLTDGTVTYRLDGMILGAGEYRLLFLGAETTGFALSSSGRDSIQLQDPMGNIISQTKMKTVAADQVMAYADGVWVLSDQPSPGFSNDQEGRAAFRTGTAVQSLSVQISEVLIANRMSLPDEKGIFSDVVELHNPTDAPVCLSGWHLSDDVNRRFRYHLPDVVIPAGGYVLIHCDGENYISEDGVIHANFALRLQEQLCLSDPDGAYITLQPQYGSNDISLALTENGYELMASSLGFANTEQGCTDARQARIDGDSPLVISEVLTQDSAVPYEGTVTDVVELWNRSDKAVSLSGWYLSDGSDPYAYSLPDVTLAANEYLVLPLTQQTAGFALSAEETLYLMNPAFFYSQPVTCGDIPAGTGISLVENEAELSYALADVSLGYENTKSGARLFAQNAAGDALRLNEAMSSNSAYLPGPYHNTTDWVELYNAGSKSIDLSRYSLRDATGRKEYPLPDKTIEPGQYLVILLAETDKNLPKGYSWLPITLSADGDCLYLMKDGTIADYLILPELLTDTVWGRPAGEAYAAQLTAPTPGEKNAAEAKISQMPAAGQAQGSYEDISSLTISLSGAGEIYYTTDCTMPDRNSKRYTGPFEITKTTVVRAVCYESGCTRSEVLDLTYLLNEGDSLPTVCLVASPEDLWSNISGIYATGTGASTAYPYYGANYWKNIEKHATVSLFEENGIEAFSEKCGLKIFGGFSRAQAKKSFACMFRNKYGPASLDYPLFGEEGLNSFESFVLRAGGQDAGVAKIRDEMITSLAADYLGLPTQQYRPVVLYLNGEYWGIYFIREKLSDQYVAGHYNADSENVTIAVQEGRESLEYMALRSYLHTHRLSEQEYFDYVCTQVNVDNYLDYVIAQLWNENRDLGNVKFFKTTETVWHWALFDTDVAMFNPARNTLEGFLSRGVLTGGEDVYSRLLMVRLLENEAFQEKFLRRTAWQLETVWNEQVVTERIDYFCKLLEKDIEKECKRWGPSVETWKAEIQVLRDFAARRNEYFVRHVQSHFHLTDKQMRDYGFEV